MMTFQDFDPERHFRELWESVAILRDVPYSLFTFGESDLPYYLVVDAAQEGERVSVNRGNVKVTRPMLVTPDTARPEFENFFEEHDFSDVVEFLMARTAAFSNLKMVNHRQSTELVSDSVEEIASKLNRQLDDEEEDRIAILAAPHGLGGIAVLRYTTERIMESAPGNIQELRERGFLPE
jgi:HD-GYP domain-containing protein (c-di-GMP phosphodiesterase class II)